MKRVRQEKILEIVSRRKVETQEELTGLLAEEGFSVTQATVSRDIKELRLIKVPSGNGTVKYAPVGSHHEGRSLHALFAQYDASFDYAGNTVVIKCAVGTAQALCAMLDREASDKGIVGTLAGDDTIFVLMRTKEAAADFCRTFGA